MIVVCHNDFKLLQLFMMIKGANVVILFLFSRYFQKKKQRCDYSVTIFQLWQMWFSPFIKEVTA